MTAETPTPQVGENVREKIARICDRYAEDADTTPDQAEIAHGIKQDLLACAPEAFVGGEKWIVQACRQRASVIFQAHIRDHQGMDDEDCFMRAVDLFNEEISEAFQAPFFDQPSPAQPSEAAVRAEVRKQVTLGIDEGLEQAALIADCLDAPVVAGRIRNLKSSPGKG